jgi:hypothetical protein
MARAGLGVAAIAAAPGPALCRLWMTGSIWMRPYRVGTGCPPYAASQRQAQERRVGGSPAYAFNQRKIMRAGISYVI